jgi:L,D-transpeptidase YcbB
LAAKLLHMFEFLIRWPNFWPLLSRLLAPILVIYVANIAGGLPGAMAASTPPGSSMQETLRQALLSDLARRSDAGGSDLLLPVLADFYEDRANAPLWIAHGKVLPRAAEFIDMLRTARDDVLEPDDYGTELLAQQLDATRIAELAHLELDLSGALLSYTRHLAAGRVQPQRVNPEVVIEPEVPAPAAVLRGLRNAVSVRDYATTKFEPQTPRYTRLRGALRRYRKLTATGGWPATATGELLKDGMTDAMRVATLRQRLLISGDLAAEQHAGDVYDGALVTAVKRFQARHGLEVDGVIGENTVPQLNVSAAQRVRQLELNMERRRWMRDDLGDFYVFVNLADQYLKVVERQANRERTIHTALTVVGKTFHRTPVFSRAMSYIVINPSWNVPRSIAIDEFLPKLRLDPEALAEKNIRLVRAERDVDPHSIDWQRVTQRSFAWQLQQRPGENNALGEVKFMFPNRFNVYIHDTPAKHLFARALRAFSHGCVRVQHPFDLAEVLLARQGVTRNEIEEIRASGEERVVSLKRTIPVHVTYLTAWVNRDGSVHFRRDLYGRDKILNSALRSASPSRSNGTRR